MLHLIGFIIAGLIVGFIACALKGNGDKSYLGRSFVVSILGSILAGAMGGYIASVIGAVLALGVSYWVTRARTFASF